MKEPEPVKDKQALRQELDKEIKSVFIQSEKPKILICTPEITELPQGMGNAANFIEVKGGGLGDISAGLVKVLEESGQYEIHVVLPQYDTRIRKFAAINTRQVDQLAVILREQGIHLVSDSAFSYLNTPYDENSIHTPIRRSLVFQRHIINHLLDYIQPDVVHCNDWMTGLIPAACREKGIKSVFTLHNIFTERESLMNIELSGIKPHDFAEWLYYDVFPDNIKQNWGKYFKTLEVDFTASAIIASDYFNTVSKTFLKELCENYFPEIVPASIYEAILTKVQANRADGIINAPNETNNPEVIRGIINYTKDDMPEKKAQNKALFQKKMGLLLEPDVPLFFWPNRLYYQKAPDMLLENAKYFLKKFDMQIAVVSSGDKQIEQKMKVLAQKEPRFAYQTFEPLLSNLGKAAADFILMPSRYEPCGLPQMEAPRLGTLPVVRATGGLKDTVRQMNWQENKGNGFLFEIADKYGLEYGIQEAIKFYRLPRSIRMAQLQRVMESSRQEFNLENTARQYMGIYNQLIREKKG